MTAALRAATAWWRQITSQKGSPTMRRILAMAVAPMLLSTAGWAQNQGYDVSVGLLTVTAPARDVFSSTDFQVRIRRQDPAIEARVDALAEQIDRLDDEADRLLRRMGPLQRKEAESRIEPGPPLTAAERELLAELSARPLAEALDFHVRELRRLRNKDEASRRQPGPMLTAVEQGELQALADRREGVLRELQTTRGERSRTLALIYGRTRTIDSDSRTLDFNSGRILTVYDGDSVRITVVDVDLFEDDVFGSHALRVTSRILEEGSVRLGRAGSIERLELHFVPTLR